MVEKQYNKRAWNSRLKIGSSLVNILLSKDLEDITVCELEKKAKVSRSTFYRNFGNVYDVLKINMDYYYNLYKLNENNNEETA